MKEERLDLNEVEEKHQDQKDHVTGEKSVSCSIQITRQKAFQLLSLWNHLQT